MDLSPIGFGSPPLSPAHGPSNQGRPTPTAKALNTPENAETRDMGNNDPHFGLAP